MMSFMWIAAIMTLIGLGLDYIESSMFDQWLYRKVGDLQTWRRLNDKIESNKKFDYAFFAAMPVYAKFLFVALVTIIAYTLWPISILFVLRDNVKDYRKVYADWKKEQAS